MHSCDSSLRGMMVLRNKNVLGRRQTLKIGGPPVFFKFWRPLHTGCEINKQRENAKCSDVKCLDQSSHTIAATRICNTNTGKQVFHRTMRRFSGKESKQGRLRTHFRTPMGQFVALLQMLCLISEDRTAPSQTDRQYFAMCGL